MPMAKVRVPPAPTPVSADFFRCLVSNMRSGVLAIDRAGQVVLINEEARRLFRLPDEDYSGRRVERVLGEHPDILRVLSGVFDRPTLPSRAEIRLTSTDTVVGYSLSLVRSEAGVVMGATLFFKDLTYVEQMEERERLRDRLAAVGEMAAVMAHEIKNPLAGIEVLAGLVRRKTPDNPEAQALVADIIGEAKMANAIVQEVLEFVRPVRLQVEATSLRESLTNAITMADGHARRGHVQVHVLVPERLPQTWSSTPTRPSRVRGSFASRRGRPGPLKRARWSPTPSTRFAASSSTWSTTVPGFPPTRSRRCSSPSSRPSRRGRASAWRSSGRSSTRTRAASIWPTPKAPARRSG
jgi:signal transduction histidine kinase